MKEIIIKVPDNYELKQDGNTYTIVEKEKKLTYEDVARKLFNNCCCYINTNGDIVDTPNRSNHVNDLNNCITRRQAEKLLAINKLMNVAKYLNGDWQPNWNDNNEYKCYICYINSYLRVGINNSNLRIDVNTSDQNNFVYFKSVKLAQQAIKILGEDTIKLALCTDY